MTTRLNKELGLTNAPWISERKLVDNNSYKWDVTIVGPPGTPYEGGEFRLRVSIPPNFPQEAPSCRFKTKIFHPNFSVNRGECCSKIISDNWSSGTRILQLLEIIYNLLKTPDLNNAFEPSVARIYQENRNQFNEEATRITILNAKLL